MCRDLRIFRRLRRRKSFNNRSVYHDIVTIGGVLFDSRTRTSTTISAAYFNAIQKLKLLFWEVLPPVHAGPPPLQVEETVFGQNVGKRRSRI